MHLFPSANFMFEFIDVTSIEIFHIGKLPAHDFALFSGKLLEIILSYPESFSAHCLLLPSIGVATN